MLGGEFLVEEDPIAAICLRKLCEASSKASNVLTWYLHRHCVWENFYIWSLKLPLDALW